jgi:hypothetical protein
MQNKANFRKSQMDLSNYMTKNYGNWTLGERGKNEPKTNPILAQKTTQRTQIQKYQNERK